MGGGQSERWVEKGSQKEEDLTESFLNLSLCTGGGGGYHHEYHFFLFLSFEKNSNSSMMREKEKQVPTQSAERDTNSEELQKGAGEMKKNI